MASNTNTDLSRTIGQLLIVGFTGTQASDPQVQELMQDIRARRAGGVVLMPRNIQNYEQVKKLVADLKSQNPRLLVAIDQEGGSIQRLRNIIGNFPSALTVARTAEQKGGDLHKTAYDIYAPMAKALNELGINLNFAPDVDIHRPENKIIGRWQRSYGIDSAKITVLAQAFDDALRASGVFSVWKHFPGHGSSTDDTHLGNVDVSKTWATSELQPYIKAQPKAIVMAHVVQSEPFTLNGKNYKCSDERKDSAGKIIKDVDGKPTFLPASFSASCGTLADALMGKKLLRFSDDLNGMAAAQQAFPDPVARAVAGFAASDVLTFVHSVYGTPNPAATIKELNQGASSDTNLSQLIAGLTAHAENNPAFRARLLDATERRENILQKMWPQTGPAPTRNIVPSGP